MKSRLRRLLPNVFLRLFSPEHPKRMDYNGHSTILSNSTSGPSVSSSRDRAEFAVASRLLSCLVTEQILAAIYVPLPMIETDSTSAPVQGFAVVLAPHKTAEDLGKNPIRPEDILAVVALHHRPVFRDGLDHGFGHLVGLIDPLDMLPHIYKLDSGCINERTDIIATAVLESLARQPWNLANCALHRTTDPVTLWQDFTEGFVLENNLREVIQEEIQSSVDWQAKAYDTPPACPNIASPAIEWEQSLVAGHPTHPMHRARMIKNNPSASMEYDWYHPRIRFVSVPRSSINLLGDFEQWSKRMVAKAEENAGFSLPPSTDIVYVPVHDLQIENIRAKFKDVEILDAVVSIPASAQSSIRTVTVPDFPGIALKLAVGVKISSSLRTISHFTADFGPRFSKEVVPKLAIDPLILAIELEPSSAVYKSDDPEVAKHFTAVIRDEFQPGEGEVVIVCAALLEMDHMGVERGISAVEHALSLDTRERKEAFIERYIAIACRAFLPALFTNGVAFEAHAQNVLARFDVKTLDLKGFVFRDLGGLRIHPPTLRRSTGIDFKFLPGHCVATETLEETFPKFYHTFVHNHIQRLIRVLGMHYDGRGWEILRKEMGDVIPQNHPAWRAWMHPESKTVDSKCLMRMRMKDSYRNMVYSPYSNMIQYRPSQPL